VFLTGGSGFIGRALLPRLTAGGFSVRALRHEHDLPPCAAEVVTGSLARVSELRPLLAGMDAVVHCAALLDPVEDEARADLINHRATANLAAAAAQGGVRTFIHLSSQAAVGSMEGATGSIGPDAPCAPTTHYGRSKRAAEQALGSLSSGEMRIVILRPPTVYGPGERRNFLALVRAIDTGLFVIPGRGRNRISFCAAANLAHAVAFCLTHEQARHVIHVADEPAMTFRESVALLARALGTRILPLPFPESAARAVALGLELGFRAVRRPPPLSRARLRTITADCALDTSQSRQLGLSPVMGFREAIAETIAEYRRAGLLRAR
jgi:nucleoside-diphosphate-sugar epimerase